jgi:hypothetical protein
MEVPSMEFSAYLHISSQIFISLSTFSLEVAQEVNAIKEKRRRMILSYVPETRKNHRIKRGTVQKVQKQNSSEI